MFGRRSDGKELKKADAIFKLMPNLMVERCDAQVFFNQDVPISAIILILLFSIFACL